LYSEIKKTPEVLKHLGFFRIFSSEWDYIRIHITPTLTYLRTSLQTSLQIHPKQKANRKMTSLRSGVKIGFDEEERANSN